MYCTNCKTLLPQSEAKCVKCGKDPKSGNKFCSSCGHDLPIGAETCPECGLELVIKISDRNGIITILLVLYLGIFGIDRFYTKNILFGILKLITLGGLGVWWVIDIILLITGRYKDGNGRIVTSKSGG